MKIIGLLVVGAACLGGIIVYGTTRNKESSTGTQSPPIGIGRDPRIAGYQTWHKVNANRMRMQDTIASLCIIPKQYTGLNPHVSKYITVYVNEKGKSAMLSNDKTEFPVGSIIVKEKYSRLTGGQVELLTIMIKREKGFDPTVGDWEFITADREDKVYKNVNLAHCISCHQQEPEKDFTFRSYLPTN